MSYVVIIPFLLLYFPRVVICQQDGPSGLEAALPETAVQQVKVHVFVHGSLHVWLTLLSPQVVLHDAFEGLSWYERSHAKMRGVPSNHLCMLPLERGLYEATDFCNGLLDQAAMPLGAGYIINCFKHCNAIVHPLTLFLDRYFTFGWSGLISEQKRYEASVELYHALAAVRDSIIMMGKKPVFMLYAFSHGGQLALHLPAIEAAEKRHLYIDTLVLLAVPLFRFNTRSLIATDFFGTIINSYSPDDFVQKIDRFSTPDGTCFATLAETIPIPSHKRGPRIIDLAITLGQRYRINHCGFFDLNKLWLTTCRVRRSEEYKKRYKAAQGAVGCIAPYPLIVIYPCILDLIEKVFAEGSHGNGYYAIKLEGEDQMLTITLSSQAEVIAVKQLACQWINEERKRMGDHFLCHPLLTVARSFLEQIRHGYETIFKK